ncbi:hypothetical protein TNCV_2168321 [Trichonephila clavipes]|nr:hypothetical protein TNCV_2168321 [Trichonephila clavipes]
MRLPNFKSVDLIVRPSGRVVAYRVSTPQADHLIGISAKAPQRPMVTVKLLAYTNSSSGDASLVEFSG